MGFTVEEQHLIAMYSPASKAQVIENIQDAMPHVDERDMLDIMQHTLVKLERMNEDEFAALDFTMEDTIDE